MATVDEIRALLAEMLVIYNEVREKHGYWEELQEVDLARAEYERLIAEEVGKLAGLQQRKQYLVEEKRKLVVVPDRDNFEPTRRVFPIHRPTRWDAPPTKTSEPHRAGTSTLDKSAERHQLIKLVNRWKYSWQLDSTVLGKINRIANDADSPLGEALILLDWSVFADRTLTQESPEMHLERLSKWRTPLIDYRGWLERDIDRLEVRFRGLLKVWELWRARTENEQANKLWMSFIADTRRVKRDEIAALEAEITQLTDEIGRLREQLQQGGNVS